MKEKIDELYEQYLNEKLDLIFNEDGRIVVVYYKKNQNKKKREFPETIGYEVFRLNDGRWGFKNKEGKVLAGDWSSRLGTPGMGYTNPLYEERDSEFYEGYAIVSLDYGFNFIDGEGNLISDFPFDEVWNFHDGYAKVKKNRKYNLINAKGKLISEVWYDDVGYFHDGYAKVKKDRKYNLINQEGNLISEVWYEDLKNFSNGYAAIRKNNKWYIINYEGKIISETWYDEIIFLPSGYIKVRKNNSENILDFNFKPLFKWKSTFSSKSCFIELKNFLIFNDEVKCKLIELAEYQIKKTLFGYQCNKDDDIYNIKYKPIKIFGRRYTICIDGKKIYLYDRDDNEYKSLGTINDVEYNDFLIHDNVNKKVYLIYKDKMFDITNYYENNLKNKDEINICENIPKILTKKEFWLMNIDEIEQQLQQERENNRKIKEAQRKQKQLEDLEKAKEQEKFEEEKRREIEQNALENIQQILSILQQVSSPSKTVTRINVDNIFIPVDDHLEIIPVITTMLRYVDLSCFGFDNVKVNGLDFSRSNIMFNPQFVYNKDLSNCNFEGVYIGPFMNFTGVDIRGTKFSTDTNPTTLDIFNLTFKDAIYDENTTYNGVPFTKLFNPEQNQTKGSK